MKIDLHKERYCLLLLFYVSAARNWCREK